tara:strand:+ start:2562 stop:3401 length:840 start_codon:yes stop_codon:yes gene_type:complete
MANGFTNPYAVTDPITLDDLNVYGQSKYVDLKRREEAFGPWVTQSYTNPEDFEYSINELGLPNSALTGLIENFPQQYDYSGISQPIQSALADVFGDSEIYSKMAPFDFGDVPGIDKNYLLDRIQNLGDLEAQKYTKDPLFGGYEASDEALDPLLENIGLAYKSDPLSSVDIFNRDSIATALGLEAKDVKALTPEMFEKTESKYYEPLVDDVREQAIYELAENLSSDATGGFAGSAGGASRKAQANMAYNKRIRNILEAILKQQGIATQDVSEAIYDLVV